MEEVQFFSSVPDAVEVRLEFGSHLSHKFLQFHGHHHVSFYLQFTAHEGACGIQLSLKHLQEIRRVQGHLHLRFTARRRSSSKTTCKDKTASLSWDEFVELRIYSRTAPKILYYQYQANGFLTPLICG